jgi:Tfp pilus assembly protein PilF
MSVTQARPVRRAVPAGARARATVEGLRANPDFALHRNRALSLMRAGRSCQAAAAYREALRMDPASIDAHIHLGLTLRELGLDEEANRSFLAALELQRHAGWSTDRDEPPSRSLDCGG